MLYLREAGTRDAETLLFLHGGGLSGRQWDAQFAHLNDFHCLAPDLPEQGLSRAVGPFSLHDASARLLGVIDAAAPGRRVHLIGSSLGGTLALHLLRVAPERVASVIVTGSSAGMGRALGALSLALAPLYRVSSVDALLRSGERQFRIPPGYSAAFREDMRAVLNEHFHRNSTQAMRQLRLPTATTVPVLATVGGRETWFAKDAARRIARRLPNARAVEAPGVGHLWNLEAPGLFSAMVRARVKGEALPAPLRPLR